MIEQVADSISYDWIGGDSLYGNSTELRHSLHQMGKLFVLDTQEDLQVQLLSQYLVAYSTTLA